jgi:hypothetical protein
MIYFVALIPATALAIAGYFVLYLSNRAEGTFRTFGKYLGFWAFTLAGLIVLGAIFAAAHGRRHGAMIGVGGMHGCMHDAGPGDPRFFDPRLEAPRDSARRGETEHGAVPQAPAGAPNPTAPPGPASPSPQ